MSTQSIHHDTSKVWRPADLDALDFEQGRYEIAGGVLEMTPHASLGHQETVANLFRLIAPQLPERLTCAADPGIVIGRSYRMPDFAILRRHGTASQLTDAPGSDFVLVAEVVSRSTAANDRFVKAEEYASAGIGSYLILDPKAQAIQLLRLDVQTGRYREDGTYRPGDTLTLTEPLPLRIDVAAIFR